MVTGTINKYSNNNLFIISCCEKIAEENNVKNGGSLHFSNVIKDCDVIFCFENLNEVLGYIGLKYYDCFDDGIYIEQLAVSKKHIRNKIGTKLLEEAKTYAFQNNIQKIYANVRKENLASNKIFQSCKFSKFEMKKNIYLSLGFKNKDIKFNNAYKIEILPL